VKPAVFILLDLAFSFIFPSTLNSQMFYSDSKTHQLFHKARGVIFLLALPVLFVFAAPPNAVGQTPSAIPREPPKPTTPPRSRPRPRPRPPVTDSATTSASAVSKDLVTLGDRFRKKEKWNAAEAAYKEAVTAWRGNGDALLALGYLYLDVKDLSAEQRLEKARTIHNQLRSVDGSLASLLLIAINDFKEARVAR
jgi:hypothetical protein